MRTTLNHLWLIHGFLGEPKDWDFLEDSSLLHSPTWTMHTLSLENYLEDETSFLTFAKEAYKTISQISGKHFLCAYSLGGRLGLHLAIAYPDIFQKCIFVSTHTGLKTKQERSDRLKNDLAWAEKFEEVSWEKVINEWNSQGVFTQGLNPTRFEPQNRRALGLALKNWSLGHQEDLSLKLPIISPKSLWMVGEKDEKFKTLALNLKEKIPDLSLAIVQGAGHRLPWDQPQNFMYSLETFLAQ